MLYKGIASKISCLPDRILRKEEKICQPLEIMISLQDLASEHGFLFPKLNFAPDVMSGYRLFFNKLGVSRHLQRLMRLGYAA